MKSKKIFFLEKVLHLIREDQHNLVITNVIIGNSPIVHLLIKKIRSDRGVNGIVPVYFENQNLLNILNSNSPTSQFLLEILTNILSMPRISSNYFPLIRLLMDKVTIEIRGDSQLQASTKSVSDRRVVLFFNFHSFFEVINSLELPMLHRLHQLLIACHNICLIGIADSTDRVNSLVNKEKIGIFFDSVLDFSGDYIGFTSFATGQRSEPDNQTASQT